MNTEKQLSKCCNAPVEIKGEPDFIGSKHVCTMYNECTKCKKGCDIKTIKRICFECGKKRCPNPAGNTVTFGMGVCDVCGKKKSTTSARHYPIQK